MSSIEINNKIAAFKRELQQAGVTLVVFAQHKADKEYREVVNNNSDNINIVVANGETKEIVSMVGNAFSEPGIKQLKQIFSFCMIVKT